MLELQSKRALEIAGINGYWENAEEKQILDLSECLVLVLLHQLTPYLIIMESLLNKLQNL